MYFNAPKLQQRIPIKKISWTNRPPNPPSKLTAALLDRQISLLAKPNPMPELCSMLLMLNIEEN